MLPKLMGQLTHFLITPKEKEIWPTWPFESVKLLNKLKFPKIPSGLNQHIPVGLDISSNGSYATEGERADPGANPLPATLLPATKGFSGDNI